MSECYGNGKLKESTIGSIIGVRIPTGLKNFLSKDYIISELCQQLLFGFIEERYGLEVLDELCQDSIIYKRWKSNK